jgi:hypothetical protein
MVHVHGDDLSKCEGVENPLDRKPMCRLLDDRGDRDAPIECCLDSDHPRETNQEVVPSTMYSLM